MDGLGRHGNSLVLPALGASPEYRELFATRDCRDTDEWRVVELLTNPTQTGPWQARIEWGAGEAGIQQVELVVPRMARTCIRASTIRVWGANLCATSVQAFCAVSTAPAVVPTENIFEVRGTMAIGITETVQVPAWAKAWRFECVGAAPLAGTTLRVYDGAGTNRHELVGSAQPSGGWSPVGDADHIDIVPGGNVAYRLLFLLHL